MSYQLVVEKGHSKGRALRLKTNGTVVVGRESSNQLVISDPQTSRRHFQIEAKLGEFVIADLTSSNGTFVNGERVERTTLKPGDKIAIGDTLVYFLKEAHGGDEDQRRGELTGREVAGYRLGRLLGRGGMGTVYEALQVSLERTVAFKVLAPELTSNPEFIERFISEARAAGRLSHANIVAVFDVGHEGDLHFYSMEYMAGGSVEDLLRQRGPLPFEETIPIIFDAARGLEYAERHGLIHRDIKPDNLMLGTDDVVKICDLGLATFQSRQHEVSGSPLYIAPEQALGKEIDHRVDLYSLGVTWYQLLCGETPFSGRSPQEIARKHVDEEPPPLAERAPQVPADVASVVARLMEKDPAQRLPSARQLQADLATLARRYPIRETVLLRIDAVAPDEPPSDELLEAAPSAPAPPRGQPYLALALLAAALLAGAFLLTRSLMGGAQRRREEALVALAAARQRLEQGELEQAQGDAQELAERLSAQGLTEEAQAAVDLAEEAGRRQEARHLEAQEQEARAKLTEAADLFSQHKGGPPGDRASSARLRQVERLLGALIEEFPRTSAATEAQRLQAEVIAERERLEEEQRQLAKRQSEARRALMRTKQGIESLLAEERIGKFQQALERAREYQGEFGDVEQAGGQALVEMIRDEATREVNRQVNLASQHTIRGEWPEARAALQPVQPPLGFPELEEKVARAEQTLAEQEGAVGRERDARQRRADEERLAAALRRVAEARQQRDFARAASDLRSETPLLETSALLHRAQLHVRRLEGAARSLQRLADHVRQGRPGVELELEFPQVGRQLARAVGVDITGRRYTFEHPPFLQSVQVEELAPDQLLGYFRALALGPEQRLDLACLAYELGLGQASRGELLLQELRPLLPQLRDLVDELTLLGREE